VADLVQSEGASWRAVSADVQRSANSESDDATYVSRNYVEETTASQETSGRSRGLNAYSASQLKSRRACSYGEPNEIARAP